MRLLMLLIVIAVLTGCEKEIREAKAPRDTLTPVAQAE